MDENAFGIITWVVIGVGGVIVALAATGGILYATDYGLEATIIDKHCGVGGGNGGGTGLFQASYTITVKTKMWGIEHTLEDVPPEQCGLIQKGNFVRYHIESQRTIIWKSEGGACVYDTHPSFPTVCGE